MTIFCRYKFSDLMILTNSCSHQEKSVENNKDKVSFKNCYSEMHLKFWHVLIHHQ